MRELSLLSIILGIILGALLSAAAAYVGLKVGMTISASIPAAVLSMAILRGLLNRGTILENNIVQTIASAGESLAAGMIFTIPALYLMDYKPALLDMVIWAGIGGLLGVVFMVPLRRVLIVAEHDTLPYPEGVACAEVLRSGNQGGTGAKKVFWGLGVAAFYELLRRCGCWKNEVDFEIASTSTNYKTAFSMDASPALLGVGYILGVRVAGYILGGAVLGWFVIIPAIAFFGAHTPLPIFPETAKTIAEMGPYELYNRYLKYIGAGAVTVGGLISLIKSIKTIVVSVSHMARDMFVRSEYERERTDRDIPIAVLILLLIGLSLAMWQLPQVHTQAIGAVTILIAALLFVSVSSRLVGLVGSSSNPISGMTIATLLGTSLLFAHFVGTDTESKISALCVGAIVCIAIGVAGDCSQDLKTGFLVKATPWKQQVGEIIGVLATCVVVAGVIQLLHDTYGFGERTLEHPNALLAPQANIMKLVIEGVMDSNLPWVLIISGGAVAVMVELFGLPSLPVAVGLYLPLCLSTPIMAGGMARWLSDRMVKRRMEADNERPGILTASGFVAGEGLIGVGLAGITAAIGSWWHDLEYLNPLTGRQESVVPSHLTPWLWQQLGWEQWHLWGLGPFIYDLLPLGPFIFLVIWLLISAARRGDGFSYTYYPPVQSKSD